MKLYRGIYISLAAAALLSACSKEDPFTGPVTDGPTGTLMTSCLAPSLRNAEGTDATRAGLPDTGDFTVTITPKSARSNNPITYKYAEMPEVLTLPVGEYEVTASHGDDKVAAWEEPFYKGASSFSIEENEITDEIDPIVAMLSNIRVTISFHPSLVKEMGPDAKVDVKVGDMGTMTFTDGETRSAYFKFVDASYTLAATFSGTVQGAPVTQVQTYANVAPGNHYKITFSLHNINQQEPGDIQTGVKVDTTVETVDMDVNVDGATEEPVTDDMRPNQGGGDKPDKPDKPDVPDNPDVKKAPVIAPKTKAGMTSIDFDKENVFDENLYCAFDVTSTAAGGFTEFTVDIISGNLTEDELAAAGLSSHLDIANTDPKFADALQNLGFAINQAGKSYAEFDITTFRTMLEIFGAATHTFKIKVADANGSTEKSLTVRIP